MRKSVWLFTLLLLCSCVNNHRLSKALELAGSNRGELEKVLIHYKDSGEKYKAACFLIENMPLLMNTFLMPVAGLEPARIAPLDFESSASANSATAA